MPPPKKKSLPGDVRANDFIVTWEEDYFQPSQCIAPASSSLCKDGDGQIQ